MTTILDAPGTNPPNPFSTYIHALSADGTSASEAAASIVAAISDSPDPANALWQLWDAFFTAVTTSSYSDRSLLALLDALGTQPPTQSTRPLKRDAARALRSYADVEGQLDWATLPAFSAQWRDVHDILQSHRDWDGVRAGSDAAASSPPEPVRVKYLRFCAFSARIVGARHREVRVAPVWVFFACRDALERKEPAAEVERRAHRLSPEQVRALDVRVAAGWIVGGGRALFETGQEDLRRYWAVALDEKTDYWAREDGLTQDRWRLWAERLRASSVEMRFDEETRTAAKEAADVVDDILETAGRKASGHM